MATSPPSEPTEPRPPWLDTPTCKLERAGGECGGPLTAADPLLGARELWCCACGRKSAATPEDVNRALAADRAWEAEQDRVSRKAGESDRQDVGALNSAIEDDQAEQRAASVIATYDFGHGKRAVTMTLLPPSNDPNDYKVTS